MALSLELTDTFYLYGFSRQISWCFNLFVLLLVTPCFVVAVQPSIELIPIKEKNNKNLREHKFSHDLKETLNPLCF